MTIPIIVYLICLIPILKCCFYSEYKNSLWSPTYVLATQIGNSLEISNILVSFLIGFGFSAYVVCGWVDKATSIMDRKLEKCPLLSKTEIEHEKDTSQMSTKYTPKKPPELKSKYMQFLNKARNFLCIRRKDCQKGIKLYS